MLKGTIQAVVVDKGFGFIRPQEGGDDVFFHRSVVRGPFEALARGEQVDYTLDTDQPNKRASFVASTNRSTSRPAARPPSRRPQYAPAQGATRTSKRTVEREFGFVTKLHRNDEQGYISSVNHGPELLFEANNVIGEKPYAELRLGDFVQFVRYTDAKVTDGPMARSVKVVERSLKVPRLSLPRQRKARGKKPSWR